MNESENSCFRIFDRLGGDYYDSYVGVNLESFLFFPIKTQILEECFRSYSTICNTFQRAKQFR